MTSRRTFISKAFIWGVITLCTASTQGYTQTYQQLILYISADQTNSRSSGEAIEQGLRTALSEINYTLGSYKVIVKSLDHRGSTPRATKHFEQYLQDTSALALFSGLHSPPLLKNLQFIHQNKILVLDPWAAAGPITRYPSEKNWIFRLSIDDSKAGYVISKFAVDKKGVSNPALLLEQTGWGQSNKKTMSTALEALNITPNSISWFNWGISKERAIANLQEIKRNGADAIFLVANSTEGKTIISAMETLPPNQKLPIFSHWGITGGDFPEVISHAIRQNIYLSFIQTRFSFLSPLNEFQQNVFNTARSIFPEIINQPKDIKSPTGFIHAYDLTKLFIAAFNQALKDNLLTGVITKDREIIRTTLENIRSPIQGLIKEYRQPFSPYSKTNPDAHEALNINDYAMAYYGKENEIYLHE